jgi:hypothetical protein
MSGYGDPLPGPLDTAPRVSQAEALALVDQAVQGLPLGAYDQGILIWLTFSDQATAATVASLLARARRFPGITAGPRRP